MDKPKILLLYDFLSEAGGVENIMLNQAKALKKEGYDITISFAYVDNNLKHIFKDFVIVENSKLFIHNESLQIMWSFINPFTYSFLKKFDLIISHSFIASWICYINKKVNKIPYAIVLHHPPNFLYDIEIRWTKDSLKRKIAYLVGKIFGIFLRKIDKMVVNGTTLTFVDSNRSKRRTDKLYKPQGILNYPAIQTRFQILKNPQKKINSKYLFAGGRIIRDKRFDYLINLLPFIDKSIKLVLAGQVEDSYKNELISLAKELGVDSRVIFYGQAREELTDLYNNAEVSLLSCPLEDFGLMVVESMACGTPIIAWGDNAGPDEVIQHGVNGFLAEPYDIKDYAEKVNLTLTKKWNKEKIRNSVLKFTEEVQSKIFIDNLKQHFPFLNQ